MKQFRNNIIRAGLEALYFTGAHHLLRPVFAGVGGIFMLHHVRPRRDSAFQPNHHLEITPDFLRATLAHLRASGIEIVTVDEMYQRLMQRDFSRRFACFTFDDGYRDNRDFALPVMREFDAPFTVYVASDFAEGTGRLWWVALEMVVAKAQVIEAEIGGVAVRLDASTADAKQAAFDRLHDWMRALPGEHDIRREVSALCARHGVDENVAVPRSLHVVGRIEDRSRTIPWSRSARIPSPIATSPSRRRQSPAMRWPSAVRGSKPNCSAPSCISPILTATGSRRGRANSRWRRRPDSRPR